MNVPSPNRASRSELYTSVLAVAIITALSTVLMLRCTSPELVWDEADYANAGIENHWKVLWAESDYARHGHGPMGIYLAKLGYQLLPKHLASVEVRLRFFDALAGSLGVGLLYWILRHLFHTSRPAAIVGSALLLCSVIRLKETYILGPHHLMLLCTLLLAGLGYHWLETAPPQAGIALGVVMGFGGLSMTYIIPAALCWALAVALAGKQWFAWYRDGVRLSWSLAIAPMIATVVVLVLWPPGVLQHVILSNFHWYMHYRTAAVLVGDRVFTAAPRWAFFYWLGRLDLPVLLCSACIVLLVLRNASKTARFSSKHLFLGIFAAFFLGTALAAHMAGSRNILQFVGILCLTTGALYDEALRNRPQLARIGCVAILLVAIANLAWLSRSDYHFLASDGYRAFLRENAERLHEHAKAIVFNTPAFKLYTRETGTEVAWDISEAGWTTRADFPLPADVKYVLVPAYFPDDMPPEQPLRRIVARDWKLTWTYREGHVWELRLYEKPEPTSVRVPPASAQSKKF